MNEIPQVLEPKEKVVYDGKPRYAPYIISAIFGSIIFSLILGFIAWTFLKSFTSAAIIGVVVFILGIILSNMAYTRTHYAITNKRAVIQSGIIGRDFKSIDYDRMQNVSVDVGILGVIFKVGSVKIFTGELMSVNSGRSSSIHPKYDIFRYITAPYEVLKQLQTYLSIRKEELG